MKSGFRRFLCGEQGWSDRQTTLAFYEKKGAGRFDSARAFKNKNYKLAASVPARSVSRLL